jgi:hypothetical protein
VVEPCAVACPNGDAACADGLRTCRTAARQGQQTCRAGCAGRRDLRCQIACDRERAAAEAACGFTTATTASGPGTVPDLPAGRPADLSILLDDVEQAVVAAADARAVDLRSRPLRLFVGRPGAAVTVTQTRHAFQFGFPVDFREFANAPEDLAFYESIATPHTNFVVAETSLKWRVVEPTDGQFFFDLADDELAWAQGLGLPVKGHTLLWGNAPPFSTGSGIPTGCSRNSRTRRSPRRRKETLRGLLRRRVETTVGPIPRPPGHLGRHQRDAQPLHAVVHRPARPRHRERHVPVDPRRRSRRAARLQRMDHRGVHGLPGPNAAAVRDRVLALRAAGVPIDAVGQQAHFVPGIVYAGGTADLSQRTRVDDYAVALDTLAETGLPLHMTEVNFIAPDEPEARAAEAEAIMRLWWGHPAVEQIVFWSLWNKVAARGELNAGLWDDAGVLTRHGEAIVSLLNDRWRTRAVATADAHGIVELRATLGDYVASWDDAGSPLHVDFRVDRGPGTAVVAAVVPSATGGVGTPPVHDRQG